MDKSKINQTELDFSTGLGSSKLNIYSGRMLFECPGFSIGANTFEMGISLIYNSHYNKNDYGNMIIGFGNGWKLNIHQYVFPYQSTYNIEGFEENDYVYIDSNWNIHRFVQYKEIGDDEDKRYIYYDACGSGLRLSTGEDKYPEISDGNNSRIIFNLNGQVSEIISCLNSNIIKKIIYEGNKIISIYDTRKSTRKIDFIYNSQNDLINITSPSSSVGLELIYNINNLEKVNKLVGSKSKGMMFLKYTDLNKLEYAIELESMKALCFNYSMDLIDSKVTEVKNGAMREL